MSERADSLQALRDFLVARLDERVRGAEEAGDPHDRDFALVSRKFALRLGHDIKARPWAHVEIERYLLRNASRYRRHPEYSTRWVDKNLADRSFPS